MNNKAKAPKNSHRISMSFNKPEADELLALLGTSAPGVLNDVYARLRAGADRRDGILAQYAGAAE